jgi:hypothetical protein
MITFIIGASIISLFCLLFYLEDRDGVGIYDPDPRPRRTLSKQAHTLLKDTQNPL